MLGCPTQAFLWLEWGFALKEQRFGAAQGFSPAIKHKTRPALAAEARFRHEDSRIPYENNPSPQP